MPSHNPYIFHKKKKTLSKRQTAIKDGKPQPPKPDGLMILPTDLANQRGEPSGRMERERFPHLPWATKCCQPGQA